MQGTWVPSLGGEDLLEKEMATHSSILAWKILWMEEPGTLQSMGLQKSRLNSTTQNTFLSLVSVGSPEADWQQGPMGPLTAGRKLEEALLGEGCAGACLAPVKRAPCSAPSQMSL